MVTATEARVGWLLGAAREVYRVHRGPADPDGKGWPAPGGRPVLLTRGCLRCGGRCGRGSGVRAPLVFFHRARGSTCADVRAGEIHRGCIPGPGADVLRIRARSLRASQVRA